MATGASQHLVAVAGGSGGDMDAELRPEERSPHERRAEGGSASDRRYKNRQGKSSWSVGRPGFPYVTCRLSSNPGMTSPGESVREGAQRPCTHVMLCYHHHRNS